MIPHDFNQGRIPSSRMVRHSMTGCYAIIHFGLNTYTDKEWGFGNEDPALFNPQEFDAEEIVKICRESGLDGIILVCKHHDGFCLWPTSTTDYNISSSPFRNGKGDLVRELSDACAKHGISMGFYVSPWDRNHPAYGTAEYPAIYREQLREIYSNYGPAFEAWFDGANGGDGWYGGANETRWIDKTVYYDWDTTWKLIRRLQPDAAIFSDAGPDLRWVGNEKGLADPESFATYTPHAPEAGRTPAPGFTISKEGQTGQADGMFYMPPECDVPLRNGWFYHKTDRPKTLSELVKIYLRSVGCGGFLNLGLAPMPSGRLDPADIARLHEWKQAVDALFANPCLRQISALDQRTCIVEMGNKKRFNFIELSEPADSEEKIRGYEVLSRSADGRFQVILTGKAIGRKRLKRLPETIESDALMIKITDASEKVSALKISCFDAEFPLCESEVIQSDLRVLKPEKHGRDWVFAMEQETLIRGFCFTPDPKLPPGTPDHYAFHISMDGVEWTIAAEGEFSNISANPIAQSIWLKQAVRAKFCRLTATGMLISGDNLAGLEFGIFLK